MKHVEVNFDGLVGLTHNYAGLSFGNVASTANASAVANPKQAALQGLKKMKALTELGVPQGVLAPLERPNIKTLRQLGFKGSDEAVLKAAQTKAPAIYRACCSASSMWVANAATVSPSADTRDGKVHFTPANLTNKFHRSIEHNETGAILSAVFNDPKYFRHHQALPDNEHFGDEGAANHTRLCHSYGSAGVEIFTYGRAAFDHSRPAPTQFPARQTLEASQAIARKHGLTYETTVFVQQNPAVIDQGVFHNDVICVGNRNLLFYHEEAFLDEAQFIAELKSKYTSNKPLYLEKVMSNQVSVEEAIKTYLFNTQLVSLADGSMAMIAPTECAESPAVSSYLNELVENDNPLKQVHYIDVKQSMLNGGGPACLRLRVALDEQELNAVNPACLLDAPLYKRLTTWVEKHYRDKLAVEDIASTEFIRESHTALDELTQILQLGAIYPFQQ